MWKKILIGLALLVIAFVIVVAAQPAAYRVTRSATINAPPATVFPHINEFGKWEAWSPWAKLDPNAKNTFEGPASGEGAVFAWAGNTQVGEGRMTILESRPNERVSIRLEFIKPMAGLCHTEFAFQPEGQETAVTWTMTGTNNFIGKAMCLFMNMDTMVGGQFEQGLASIKTLTEGGTQPSSSPSPGVSP